MNTLEYNLQLALVSSFTEELEADIRCAVGMKQGSGGSGAGPGVLYNPPLTYGDRFIDGRGRQIAARVHTVMDLQELNVEEVARVSEATGNYSRHTSEAV